MTAPIVLKAEIFARTAHGDALNQHDGERYILHVERVVAHLERAGSGPVVLVVAWLHDVVEDTDVDLDDIEAHFGREVRDAVDAITHRRGEPRSDYYHRVGRNRIALAVKLADGRDNQDPWRKAALDPITKARLQEKYDKMNAALWPYIVQHVEASV